VHVSSSECLRLWCASEIPTEPVETQIARPRPQSCRVGLGYDPRTRIYTVFPGDANGHGPTLRNITMKTDSLLTGFACSFIPCSTFPHLPTSPSSSLHMSS
jgi:hypothetical protein